MSGSVARRSNDRAARRPGTALLLPLLLQPLFQRPQPLAQGGNLLAEGVSVSGFRAGFRALVGFRLAGGPPEPSDAPRPLAHDAVRLALARHDALEARLERLLHELLPGLAVLDQLVEKRRGERGAPVALVLQDDLGERHGREVFARGHVDDRDLLARANQLFELLEGDVATLLRVVELAIGIPLD